MSNKKYTAKQYAQLTKEERILARSKPACGTFPGMGRARRFKDRKKEARRKACRGRVNHG